MLFLLIWANFYTQVHGTLPMFKIFQKLLLFVCLLWAHCVACGILVPWPGIEPRSSAVRMQCPNHWATREFPRNYAEESSHHAAWIWPLSDFSPSFLSSSKYSRPCPCHPNGHFINFSATVFSKTPSSVGGTYLYSPPQTKTTVHVVNHSAIFEAQIFTFFSIPSWFNLPSSVFSYFISMVGSVIPGLPLPL